jgi:PAS domain S-box-containing protein
MSTSKNPSQRDNLSKRAGAQPRETSERKGATAAFEENENWFRLLFEKAPIGVAQVATLTGQFIRVNLRYCDIVGLHPDQLMAKTFMEITHPDDLQADLDNMEKLKANEIRDFSMRKRYRRPDGTWVWVNLSVSPMWLPGEEPSYHIAMVEDISALMCSEGELASSRAELERRVEERTAKMRESEERFRTYVDEAPTGIVITDRNGAMIDVTPSAERIAGVSRAALIGKRFSDFAPPFLRAVAETAYAGFVETGQIERDVRIQRGAAIVWVNLHGVALGPDRFLTFFTDVNERKEAEAALAESETRMALALKAAKMGVWETDFESFDSYWSEESLAILGLPFSEKRLPLSLTADLVYPEDRERLNLHIKAILHLPDGPGLFDCIYRIVRADGALRWVHAMGQARIREVGRRPAYSGIILDITEQKLAEVQLASERKRLRDILDGIFGCVCLISPDGILLEVNQAPLERVGLSKEDVIGITVWNTPPISYSPEVQTRVREAVARAAAGEVTRYDQDVRVAGGGISSLDITFSPLLDEHGSITGVLAFGVDVTERNRAKNALREALDEVSQLKDRIDAENVLLREHIQTVRGRVRIIGQSAAIQNVLSHAREVAKTDSNVLILGETGTGKELLAEAIHEWSARQNRPLVRVACAAIPATLLESELFGREKGAYTGALTKQIGRFEAAEGGTLFLDEIGELPAEIQVKLLRVLDSQQFEHLGSFKTLQADVRIIAATNRDLEKAIRAGIFREDLFHRLNVFPLTIPPLRERAEDIPELVWSFVKDLSLKTGKAISVISPDLMHAIQRQPWPGNVRELRNAIERAMILSKGPELRVELPKVISSPPVEEATLDGVERAHIVKTLEQTGWRIRGENGAAKRLGLNPTTLESKMSRLGIERPHR